MKFRSLVQEAKLGAVHFSRRIVGVLPKLLVVECVCGSVKAIRNKYWGWSESCGCDRGRRVAKRSTTHGDAGVGKVAPEYNVWKLMLRRCRRPGTTGYEYYGGRGISVCPEWVASYEAFLRDMGRRPGPGFELDRFPNNDGNYEPGNVRWATRTEQNNNKRGTVWLVVDGERKSLAVWAAAFGINRDVVRRRIIGGWDAKRALTTPVRLQKNRATARAA